jgi:hypothetical protein
VDVNPRANLRVELFGSQSPGLTPEFDLHSAGRLEAERDAAGTRIAAAAEHAALAVDLDQLDGAAPGPLPEGLDHVVQNRQDVSGISMPAHLKQQLSPGS